MGDFIAELVDVYGAPAIAPVLDTIKSLGFTYATRAGISVSKNDVVIPPRQGGDPRRTSRGASPRSRASTRAA